MKVALFGGTFDPIHNAHLTVAREAMHRFGVNRVLFVPAARPPHKSPSSADYSHRYRMVELACGDQPGFEPSRLEEGDRISYSIDTIETLRAQLEPGDEIFFLIGADAFAEIGTWKRWRDVVAGVQFIVVTRPGHGYAVPPGATVHRLDTVALPVSSSDIREQLAAGKSPAELPAPVLAYIRAHGLYA